MSEIDNENSASALPQPSMPAGQPYAAPILPSRRNGALGWLWLLAIIVGAGYLYWRLQAIEHGHDQSAQNEQTQAQQLRAQVDALARSVEAIRRDDDGLRARLDDAAKVNESLRGQVLGLSERARLAEDAIANLAEKRLSGHDALLLNEAELLLVLGGERYALFSDPAPALAAYRLADGALAEANDAAFSSVRQSIAAEIDALNALQAANIPALQTQLMQLRARLAQLPAASPTQAAVPATPARWWQIFGELVRVRRDSDTQALLAHNDAALARALVDTSLRDAQSALLTRDQTHYRSALATARAQLAADFNAGNAEVIQAQAVLDELAKAMIAPPPPPVLGAALKELRNLRATRALHSEPAPAPPTKTAPSPVEGQS
ncbi:MAG: uroporphyrinogen-III C-methyltransferase [Rudaea sp.]